MSEKIISPTVRLVSSQGLPILDVKYKSNELGQRYCIFKRYDENIKTKDDREKLVESWARVRFASALLGVRLFDLIEIADAIDARIDAFISTPEGQKAQEEVDATGVPFSVGDITVSVFDHVTGEIVDLTVGAYIAPRQEEWNDVEA